MEEFVQVATQTKMKRMTLELKKLYESGVIPNVQSFLVHLKSLNVGVHFTKSDVEKFLSSTKQGPFLKPLSKKQTRHVNKMSARGLGTLQGKAI